MPRVLRGNRLLNFRAPAAALLAAVAILSFSPVGQTQEPPVRLPSVTGQPQLPALPETVVEGSSGQGQPDIQFDELPSVLGSQPRNRGDNLLGITQSASEGTFGQDDLRNRPFLRPGSVLELIPGLIATQHSGSGKANQYFLRGFNIDHGTDFLTRVDDVPINLPTHGHGQGYLDVNWLIPELIDHVDYMKGPYYAEVGDFSTAGAADIHHVDSLPGAIISMTGGSFDYYRALVANSEQLGPGTLLYAYEEAFNNGPWVVPEGYNRFNGMLKYTVGDETEGMSITALGYRGYWTATNQIAERAVDAGIVSRFGSLDPSDGGDTDRVTLNAQYWREYDCTITRANVYTAYYALDLFSNFTYFLDDPVNGDQIEQIDRRVYSGANVSRQWLCDVGSNTLDFQFRNDNIMDVSLNHTSNRRLIDRVSSDAVDQQSYSLYGINELRWTDWFRSNIGLRGDWYRFHARDRLTPADSGTANAFIFSPKTGLVFGPWCQSEIFVNWGLGFHSNDARGVTTSVDPATPLVRTNGSEIGIRSNYFEDLQTTLVGWYLESDSELVFVGDAGTTEPSGASHRAGIEWTNYYKLSDWITLDADYAWVRPRLIGGQRIPNAVENVLSAGINVADPCGGFFMTPRVQLYGPAALIEDNSARSGVTTIVNMQVGYQWPRWRAAIDIFNVLNAQANDITYYYESAPPGLPAANDYHFHPVVPVSARFTLSCSF